MNNMMGTPMPIGGNNMYAPQPTGQNPMMVQPQPTAPVDSLRMNFGMQPAQPVKQIAGRFVSSPEEIMPKEVPMDGNPYFFPNEDYSSIYVKIWTSDAQLLTFKFVPEKPEQTIPTPQTVSIPEDFKNDIFERLEKIENLLTAPATTKGGKASG